MNEQILNDFKNLLDEEIVILKQCGAFISKVKSSVKDRQYSELTENIKSMDGMAIQIKNIENKREEKLSELKEVFEVRQDSSFDDLLINLKFEDKVILSQLYQTIKLEVMKVQGLFWSISSYVEAATGSIEFMLSSLQRSSVSNTYNSNGMVSNYSSEPLLFSREL